MSFTRGVAGPLSISLLLGFLPIGHIFADEALVLSSENGDKVTLAEYKALIEGVLSDEQQAALYSNERSLKNFLLDYYATARLAGQAKAEGLDKEKAFIVKQQYQSNLALASIWLDKAVAKEKAPNYELLAEENYKANKAQYMVPEQISAAHILIAAGSLRTEEEAKSLADNVSRQLLAGKSFAELAKEYSDDDGTKESGGELGFFSRDKMVKPFSDAAFALSKPGQLSGPVKSQFGYHIIKLGERRPASVRPFSEVKANIIAGEKARFVTQAKQRIIFSAASDGVTVDEELLKKLHRP